MQITLTPELDRIVEEKVTSGLYESPSEVVREALRLMLVREASLDWLRHEAAAGFGQLDSGDVVEISRDELLAEMRERHPA
jgi:antitoxin ParD1/3/4